MLHKMSEVRGWSHDDMMSMKKHVFFRYYGYWYQDQLREEETRKEEEIKQNKAQQTNEPKNWKSLKGR